VTVREAISTLPALDYLETADRADAELAYVLAILRACGDNPAFVERLPALLYSAASEIQRVREGDAEALGPADVVDVLRRLLGGEPGRN
jgi:hypothetical protein